MLHVSLEARCLGAWAAAARGCFDLSIFGTSLLGTAVCSGLPRRVSRPCLLLHLPRVCALAHSTRRDGCRRAGRGDVLRRACAVAAARMLDGHDMRVVVDEWAVIKRLAATPVSRVISPHGGPFWLWINRMSFGCIGRFLSKRKSPLRREQRVEMLTRFFLAFSEQVLVTGRAILIVALSNRRPNSTELQAVSDFNLVLHPEEVLRLHFWHLEDGCRDLVDKYQDYRR
jgi:hypothetical protein